MRAQTGGAGMTKGLGYRRAIGAVTRSHNDGLTEASATNLVPVGAVYADPPALLPPTKSDSWVSATNGDWGTGANWSTGKVPGASTNTSIAVAGSYTATVSISEAAKSLTIDNAGATLADNASLKIGKSLSVLAGTLALGTGAEIVGGTLSLGTSAVLLSTSGTLSGITYEGSLYFDESHASLYLTNGITLTGSGGGITHTATVSLVVSKAPVGAFAISVSPSSGGIAPGSSAYAVVSTTVSGGFDSSVALSASGLPAGVTGSFGPSSIAAPGAGSSDYTLTVASNTEQGIYPITITGTSGGVSHSTTLDLWVFWFF